VSIASFEHLPAAGGSISAAIPRLWLCLSVVRFRS